MRPDRDSVHKAKTRGVCYVGSGFSFGARAFGVRVSCTNPARDILNANKWPTIPCSDVPSCIDCDTVIARTCQVFWQSAD